VLYTVIGDVVGSRRLADRSSAQRAINEALARVNVLLSPAQAFEATIGDEFQGATTGLGDAVLATLLVRLHLLPAVDVRCGIGYGDVGVLDPDRRPLLQNGPGWWAARDALVDLERRRGAAARTWYGGPDAGHVTAFLITRDALVERLNERGLRLLRGALEGRTQRELAAEEGISASAISQQFARGVGALRDAHRRFGDSQPASTPGA
jgi:hypothetical protein